MLALWGTKDQREAWVSPEEMEEVEAFFDQDPVCQGCFGLLSKILLALGAEVNTPGVAGQASMPRPSFKHYVHRYMTDFLAEAFKHVLCFGFVVWSTVEKDLEDPKLGKGRKVLLPFVVAPDLYRVRVVTRPGLDVEHELFAMRGFSLKPDPRLHIEVVRARGPSPKTGKLNGPLSSVVDDSMEMAQMFDWMRRAEYQRTHPPYTVQPRKEEAGGALREPEGPPPPVTSIMFGERVQQTVFQHQNTIS